MVGDNGVVYEARLHWIIFLWPALLLVVGLYVETFYSVVSPLGLIICGLALVWEVVMWVTYQFCSLTIKKTHVVLRTGFLIRQTLDFPLNKVESIDIQQSLLGSLLQYGSLMITGTGGSRPQVNYLYRPLTCRRHIEQLMHR